MDAQPDNRLIPRAKAAGVSTIPLDPRLIALPDVDVRIVMTWSADNTDIDLWVAEPSGEKAFYQHNRMTIGGLVSRDLTQGYRPEEYLVRRAAHGMYTIEAKLLRRPGHAACHSEIAPQNTNRRSLHAWFFARSST